MPNKTVSLFDTSTQTYIKLLLVDNGDGTFSLSASGGGGA